MSSSNLHHELSDARDEQARKSPWQRPELKRISAGAAEDDVGPGPDSFASFS